MPKDFRYLNKETDEVCISSYKPSAKWKRISRDEYFHRVEAAQLKRAVDAAKAAFEKKHNIKVGRAITPRN